MANLLGIAVLLVGWGLGSGVLITVGFLVLVASLGYRIVTCPFADEVRTAPVRRIGAGFTRYAHAC